MTTECKSSDCYAFEACNEAERKTLRTVLAINMAQFVAGIALGAWAGSTALMGVALDNLADAGVYGLSLYAVGRDARGRRRAAHVSGWLLIVLAAMLLVEVLRRFFGSEEPLGIAIVAVALANAGVNVVCLRVLARHREGVHMKASQVFTNNDMLVNLGIALSGVLVIWLESSLPDLLISLVVVAIAFRGGREILELAQADARVNGGGDH